MNQSIREAKNAGIHESLSRAGIGKAYHKRTVTELPGGENLACLVKGEFRTHVAGGGNLIVEGMSPDSLSATILIARGFHLLGLGCMVVSTSELARQLSNPRGMDEEFEHRLARMKCLVLYRFYTPDPADDGKPYTSRTLSILEDFLVDLNMQGTGLLLHVIEPLKTLANVPWYHDDFIREVTASSHARIWQANEGVER